MLVLLVCTGIYFTFRTNFLSITKFGYILKNTILKMFSKEKHGEGETTPFQALAAATTAAFNNAIPGFGGYIVSIGILLFAFSTILGWAYYGERCAEFLFGANII